MLWQPTVGPLAEIPAGRVIIRSTSQPRGRLIVKDTDPDSSFFALTVQPGGPFVHIVGWIDTCIAQNISGF